MSQGRVETILDIVRPLTLITSQGHHYGWRRKLLIEKMRKKDQAMQKEKAEQSHAKIYFGQNVGLIDEGNRIISCKIDKAERRLLNTCTTKKKKRLCCTLEFIRSHHFLQVIDVF